MWGVFGKRVLAVCWLVLSVSDVVGRVLSTRTTLSFFSARAALEASSREVVALVITFLGVIMAAV